MTENEQIYQDEQFEQDYQQLLQAFRAELDRRQAMGHCKTEEEIAYLAESFGLPVEMDADGYPISWDIRL